MEKAGYEKVAHLMSTYPETAIFKRFSFLDALNTLYLQAELVDLEQQLKEYLARRFRAETYAPIDRAGTAEDDGTNSTSGSDLLPPDPVQDWRELANAPENSEASAAWSMMLQARSKLQEYNSALLLQSSLIALPSPNTSDLAVLTYWLEHPRKGNYPLIGEDRQVWTNSPKHSLVATSPRRGRDPLSNFILKKAFIWWHSCVGHRLKKSLDEEAVNHFAYNDKHLLRVADAIGSIISSLFLVVSILVLYFVRNTLARLGIVAAFTVTFSFAMVLVTNASKAEVFAGTAAFAAVQAVFVGTTTTTTTTPQ